MPRTIKCYLKQRKNKCFYSELVNLEYEIARLKSAKAYIREKVSLLEHLFLKGKIEDIKIGRAHV